MYKKPARPSSSRNKELGIFDSLGGDSDISDADSDLEAELAAISNDSHQPKPRKKPTVAPANNLDAMIAASLRDIPSDEEVSDGEDDPELLSELQELGLEDSEPAPAPPPRSTRPAPPPPGGAEGGLVGLLQQRIQNYTLAERNAKANGESARARRFERGLKTLNNLLKQVKAGKAINEEDIPPEVSAGKAPSSVQPPVDPPSLPTPLEPKTVAPRPLEPKTIEPEPLMPDPVESPSLPPPLIPTRVGPVVDASPVEESEEAKEVSPNVSSVTDSASEERQKELRIILQRREEFKQAALQAKHSGDKQAALEYLRVVKTFDLVVEAHKNGERMDLSELPTVADVNVQREENAVQQSSDDPPATEEPAAPAGLITAETVEEALKQRLEVFKGQVEKAKSEGNSSKMRRMGRIVKQYEDAIRLNAAGRPIPVDELPTPPGYAPLPTGNQQQQLPTPGPAPAAPSPRPSPRPAPLAPRPAPAPTPAATRAGKQLAFLLQRQKEFKEAALNAKKEGDINLAKEYLRSAKGFDSLIEASRGGLAVDLNSLPLPPQAKQQLEDTFDVITSSDCEPGPEGSGDMLTRLHEQLTEQLKLCLATRDHNKAMGNVPETNRFEQLANAVKQDRDVVILAERTGGDIPKFHYEMRTFSIVQCNTDLNENDLELTIVRGIAYNVPNPKEVDTYVKFEFPYPQDAPVYDKTSIVKNTNSPEYNAVFPLTIQRNSRSCLRLFKRHGIKLEVYSRGCGCCADGFSCFSGFFSRDSLLGTVTVKLQPLEAKTTIHEAFPLMEGRRAAGGSLEVKVRVQHPLLGKQIDHSQHKWLVIDPAT